MERFGLIHEKLDIKILILFVLRRLPLELSSEVLAELVMCDGGIGYFDYAECLAELVVSGQVEEPTHNQYRISERGARNADVLEDSLPFTVRLRAERGLAPTIQTMRRNAMIKTSHSVDNSGCWAELSMSDGFGDIIRLRLLCASESQATIMEEHFRTDAESFYHHVIERLLDSPRSGTAAEETDQA